MKAKASRTTKVCPLCKRPKRLTAYPLRPDGTRSGVCIDCIGKSINARAAKRWNWKLAILKTIRQGHSGEGFRHVTEELLDVLYALQHGACALSGRRFELPNRPVNFGTSWKTMQSLTLKPGLTPELVRVNKSLLWEPGNLALICHDLFPVSEYHATLYDAYALMRKVTEHGITAPSRKDVALYDVRDDYETETELEEPNDTENTSYG